MPGIRLRARQIIAAAGVISLGGVLTVVGPLPAQATPTIRPRLTRVPTVFTPTATTTPTTVKPTVRTAAGAATAAVSMIDVGTSFAFSPTPVTVHVGDTVRWTNHSATVHTTTSDTGLWDSGINPPLSPSQSFSHLFGTAGTFTYHCNVHTFMHGTVVVQATVTTTTTTATTRPAGSGATTTVRSAVQASTATTSASGLATTGAQEAPLVGFAVAALLTGLFVVSFAGRRRDAAADTDMT